ncbi:GDSL family lipase [Pedobacter antarcticus 4BY]|uniref:GDSL family lipase n=2 Tax=Pedobacter antarcticus TaxID=34086 RepID=A0A081PCL4_9SPHI|nr:GDSL-type esterase/lipase family protein [Pedobacter antarcticus]KEQ28437.1 GDSL family lipase [Pedobacter antarcticus 4BY]SFF04039.1 Lysophospholipase L1 [Pedobacter antarcticus]
MNRILKSALFGLSLLVFSNTTLKAQEHPPFWQDIQAIKQYDRVYEPPKNPILFVGSSSIRLWVDFTKTFKDYTVLNRGIGGAVTADIDRYLEDIVFPYQPKQIVLYIGENDLLEASNAEQVFKSIKKLYTDIRTRLPEVPIIYLAIKGSPSRSKEFNKASETNRLVKNYLIDKNNAIFIDVFTPMLDKKGEMNPSIFKADQLHMNASGYAIWNKLLVPHLLKD